MVENLVCEKCGFTDNAFKVDNADAGLGSNYNQWEEK